MMTGHWRPQIQNFKFKSLFVQNVSLFIHTILLWFNNPLSVFHVWNDKLYRHRRGKSLHELIAADVTCRLINALKGVLTSRMLAKQTLTSDSLRLQTCVFSHWMVRPRNCVCVWAPKRGVFHWHIIAAGGSMVRSRMTKYICNSLIPSEGRTQQEQTNKNNPRLSILPLKTKQYKDIQLYKAPCP